MFGHHRGRGRHDRGTHERGGHGGWFEGMRERKGQRRERLFAQGDLKLVILDLLKFRVRHGYEVIKAIEDLAGGDYSPSPGVVYPTLTLLEEIGYATVTQDEAGKRQYGITAEGDAYLESQREALTRIRGRIESAGSVADMRRAPELQRAMQNFRTALQLRLGRGALEAADLRKIADAIDRAAIDIERS
jgi:DNA-binding PadR family transcriptional regulator